MQHHIHKLGRPAQLSHHYRGSIPTRIARELRVVRDTGRRITGRPEHSRAASISPSSLGFPLAYEPKIIAFNEVTGVNRVVFDISSKPPGTIEWE